MYKKNHESEDRHKITIYGIFRIYTKVSTPQRENPIDVVYFLPSLVSTVQAAKNVPGIVAICWINSTKNIYT